jgi:hypothetical protein
MSGRKACFHEGETSENRRQRGQICSDIIPNNPRPWRILNESELVGLQPDHELEERMAVQ